MALITGVENCTGCTSCMAACPVNCIKMVPDTFGFLHPEITAPDKCINCGKCDSVCPIQNEKTAGRGNERAFAAYTNDQAIRDRSSSGGIFSELAMQILTAAGIVYGAAYDEDFSVQHVRVDNIGDLHKCCGAKYAQSDLGNVFDQVRGDLISGITVLFSGTPCQVAGLHSYLKREYENLVCVDFVCHGIPSPAAWKGYLKYRSRKTPVASVNMRSKETGWSRYRYSICFNYADGSKYSSISSEDPYLKLFVGDYINRESCENCHFKGAIRLSDITLADFWGIWDLYPEMDDNKGTSALIVHTQKGLDLLEKSKDKLTLKKVTVDEVSKQNPSLLFSSKAKPQRTEALKMAINGEYDSIMEKYFPKPGLADKLKRKLNSLFYKR